MEQLNRLHHPGDDDDLFELCNYVSSNGITTITERAPESRALGIKPYSTETETAFFRDVESCNKRYDDYQNQICS